MDKDNIRELERKKPTGSKATVELLTKYIDPSNSGKHVVIRDPYYVSFILFFFFLFKLTRQ